MENILEEIGLTQNETKVYMALNRLGTSSIGPIVNKANITNSKIYIILEKLIKKGLVSHILINNVKHYKTSDPRKILEFMEEKRKTIVKQEKQIEKIIPALLLEQQTNSSDRVVEVLEGFNGIKTAREKTLNLMKEKNELLILGASKFSTSQYEYYWENFHKRRIKKKIKCRYLMYAETKDKEGKKREKWKYTKVKYMKNPTKNPIRIDIFLDYIDIAIDADKPFVISIKSKEVSDSFKKYFEDLWLQAK